MNKSLLRVLAVFSLIAAASPAHIMAQAPYKFTIPFDFTVGEKTFAAGEYRVSEVAPRVIRIQRKDLKAQMVVIGFPDDPGKVAGETTMTFHQYGDRYFLSKVSDANRGWGMPQSRGETELIAGRQTNKPLQVLASAGR